MFLGSATEDEVCSKDVPSRHVSISIAAMPVQTRL
jgi:hypothetical protein